MKFIEDMKLQEYTAQLTNQTLGLYRNRVIDGRIEAFSCKRGQSEKKACREIHERYSGQQFIYPDSPTNTSRRLYADFILTLNASFPDYDYSHLNPSNFELCGDISSVIDRINDQIGEVCAIRGAEWLNGLWHAVNEVINISDCQIYMFNGELDFDLDGDEAYSSLLWETHYFFFNRELKRIVFFSVKQERTSLMDEDGKDTLMEVY